MADNMAREDADDADIAECVMRGDERDIMRVVAPRLSCLRWDLLVAALLALAA